MCFSPTLSKIWTIFLPKGSVVSTPPVSMIMLAGGPLAAVYSISSGCGVRLFLSWVRPSRTFDEKLRKRLHTFVVFIHYKRLGAGRRIVDMKQNKPNGAPQTSGYSAPSISILTLESGQAILINSGGEGGGSTDPLEPVE